MLYRIVVKDMSARIFNVAKNEASARGENLECVDYFKGTQILKLFVSRDDQVANVLSTLQTDRNLQILEVEGVCSTAESHKSNQSAVTRLPFNPPKLELIA